MSAIDDRQNGLIAWVDRLIPAVVLEAGDQAGDRRARRARILLMVVIVSSTIGIVTGVSHYLKGDILRSFFTSFSFVPFGASILVMRATGRVEPAAHYLCFLCSFVVLLSPFLAEESVPLMVAMIAVPLAATAMGGAAIGLTWTFIVGLLLSACALWLPFSPPERAIAWNIVTLSTGCGIALVITDHARERAMQLVIEARERADENARARAETRTELADSQALFSAAFRRTPAALALTVAESGEVLDVNESFERIFECRREDVLGRDLVEAGIWWTADARSDFLASREEKTGTSTEREVLMRTSSGREVWTLISAETLDIGGRACLLAQGVDISDRKEHDRLLEQHREELEHRFAELADQLKASQRHLRERERLAAIGTLAAGIAHQINNPIGGIIAASEFALMEDSEPGAEKTQRQALATVLDEAERCGRIVKSVLQFARDEPTPKWVESLSPTIRRASELARSYVEGLGGELEIDVLAEELPVLISPIDIEQVVLNLIHNAAESRPDGARVHVATMRVGKMAEVIVTDDGRGIDQDLRSQVFDPFYTTRLEEGGSGLGLSVVHGVIGDHGGEIKIEAQSGGGSCFRISLPLVDMAETPATN